MLCSRSPLRGRRTSAYRNQLKQLSIGPVAETSCSASETFVAAFLLRYQCFSFRRQYFRMLRRVPSNSWDRQLSRKRRGTSFQLPHAVRRDRLCRRRQSKVQRCASSLGFVRNYRADSVASLERKRDLLLNSDARDRSRPVPRNTSCSPKRTKLTQRNAVPWRPRPTTLTLSTVNLLSYGFP